jgi:5'-nucleotidase / UDP-sugar diphosphatase
MRKAIRAILPLVCLLAAACGDDDGGDDDGDDGDDDGGVERRLVLFHTNDEHSHLFGFAPEIDDFPLPTEPGDGTIVGSIARRGELLDRERAALDEEGIDSLTVSAGDQTQGALPQIEFAETSPDFALMAEVGYDIMAPGNHEFDLGPEAYALAIEAVPDMPPIVSTNIVFSDDPGDDTLEALYGEGLSAAPITPYQILETLSGIRVGFVGIMGVNASDVAPNKVPVDFSADLEGVYASIQPAVDALRDQDVDLVVALSHSGVDLNTPANGEDFNIAQNVEGIDIIVSGHTHTRLDEAIIADGPDGPVPIVQTGSYGRFLGRVELILPADGGRATLATSELLSIDDTIVPSDDSITSQLDDLIANLEATVLPAQISRIEGAEVTDDPKVLGDLYYRDMGSTEFDIIGQRSRTETNMLNLSNDAKLAAAEELGVPADVAVEASGTVRDDLLVGETGVLSYADLYRVFPLGENPMDGSIGYPLCRFSIWSAELKAALEVGVSTGYVDDSFYLSTSGLFVEYDTSRDPQDLSSGSAAALDPENGRITRLVIDTNGDDVLDETDETIFDLSLGDGAWGVDGPLALRSVVTTLYIASFADSAGVVLRNDDGNELQLFDTILRRPDESDVKDYESFIRYVLLTSDANEGTLPTIYDENTKEGAIPRHMLCTGPLCE